MNILEFQAKNKTLFFKDDGEYIHLQEYCEKLKDTVPCLRNVRKRFKLNDKQLNKRLDLLDQSLQEHNIIVYEGHHTTSYYKADTTDEIGSAYIDILKNEYKYFGEEPEEPKIAIPPIKKGSDLGSSELNKALESSWINYESSIRSFKIRKSQYNLYVKAINNDYQSAYYLAMDHCESISFERLI